jgi:superfamily II DNA or RNA helicase/HKD family nuclease
VQPSGLALIEKSLFSALAAGAKVRLLVGDYLGITSPDALRQLLGWINYAGPAFAARLAELEHLRGSPSSFHPKAWRIADASGGIVVVGSSNLSRAALETGVEWNLVGETSGSGGLDRELIAAFDDLWQQATPLVADVIERYAAKVGQASACRLWDPPPKDDRLKPVLLPRPWQAEALVSLAAIRAQGYSKALVAVATGLGKTWLAAFDVVAHGKALGRPPRVLVIAHRAEILAQAETTLRQAVAPASVSYVAGASCDLSSQLVIASIQKLCRPESLLALDAAEPFDYCVIDEVHHAEAPSYRRVIARLPRHARSFTLGLTATPERTDGVDVATLFDDILAYQATIGDGIAEGSLVPFRYRGLKDDVDFEQIPWRNGRFDVSLLESALENSSRMDRLWAEWQSVLASRTLVFCCSRRHAVFVRDWLRRKGVSAAAVFSESGTGFSLSNPAASTPQAKGLSHKSDPRMASLAAFHAGSLEALCVVDLFNEGIDLPLVDRVVMLRPTESKIVFLQQLGRGLRAATGKTRLEVIDFVGNHRVFASRLVHLLSLVPRAEGAASAAAFAVLKAYLAGGEPELPAGCVLDVEVEAKRLLEQFLPKGRGQWSRRIGRSGRNWAGGRHPPNSCMRAICR